MQRRIYQVGCFLVVGFMIHTLGGCLRESQAPSFDDWLAATRYQVRQQAGTVRDLWPDLPHLIPEKLQVGETSFQLVRLLGPSSHEIQLPDRQFGICQGWYKDSLGKVLQLSISDYGADTTGFLMMCEDRWAAENQGMLKQIVLPATLKGRAWIKDPAEKGITQLEAITAYRYHLVVRYNRTLDDQTCESLLSSLPWDRIPAEFR